MVRVRFIPDQRALDNYYLQSGNGMPYFRGASHQSGHGLGGLFGSLFRAAIPVFKNTVAPVLKQGAKAVAKEALRAGVGVASDLLDGQSVHDSANARLSAAGKQLARRGIRKANKLLDEPKRRRVYKGRKSIRGRRVDALGV